MAEETRNTAGGGGGSWGLEETNPREIQEKQFRDAMAAAGFDPSSSTKPVSSGGGSAGSLYAANTGNVIGYSGYAPGTYKTPDPITARVGDYVQDSYGNWNVVPNSPTDITQRFLTTGVVNSKRDLSLTDYFNAGKQATLSAMGMPSDMSSAGSTIATGAVAQGAKVGSKVVGNPALSAAAAGGTFLSALVDAEERNLAEYFNQDFNYDVAVKLEVGEDGTTRFKPDYEKMVKTGNIRESGASVQALTDRSKSGAEMTDDNKMNITVSPVFAQSAAYAELLKEIKGTFGSLTKEQANEVVNKDTGATRLDQVKNLVQGTESNFYYNIQMVRSLKEKAPTASDESLNMAVETSKIGYLGSKTLEKISVHIYDDTNTLIETNAKEYLDSIWNMSKIERNDYMSRLCSRINDSNISDDEKAVLYAQSQALYAASDTDGDYLGMYQRDWLDEIGSTSDPFFGITFNTYFGGTDLDTFRRDELSSGLLDIGSTFASLKALTGVTNLVESGFRSATPQISNWAGESFAEASKNTIEQEASLRNVGSLLGRTGTQVGYQLTADAVYDAIKAIPYAATNTEYDYLDELGNDFLLDMLVTYGPRNFAETMSAEKSEYGIKVEDKDVVSKLNKITSKKGATKESIVEDLKSEFKEETNGKNLEKMSVDELKDFMSSLAIEYKSSYDIKQNPDKYSILDDGTGARDVKLIEVTGDELSKRRAATLAKLEDNKVIQSIQKNFYDKNAALSKLAKQVRAVSDNYHYKKFMRKAASDIRQITKDVKNEWRAQKDVDSAWKALGDTMKEVGVRGGIFRPKGLSQADNDYIKAKVNEARFLGKDKTGKKAEQIKNFYAEGKNGVSKERAQQLDSLIKAMQKTASTVVDFYVKKGLMSEKDAADLRAAPGYEDGYLPMYTVPGSKISGDISQNRDMFKRVKNEDALIALKDLENPLESLARYINNSMRAVAVNDRALAIREAATLTGVGIRVVEDEGGSLKDFKGLRATDAAFDKIFKGIAKETREKLPTFEQWQEANGKMILRSKALKTAEELRKLQDESKDLINENRRLQYQVKKLEKAGPDTSELDENIAYYKKRVSEIENDIKAETNKKASEQDDFTLRLLNIRLNEATRKMRGLEDERNELLASNKVATNEDYPGFDVEGRKDGNSDLLRMLDESDPSATGEGTLRDYFRDYKGYEVAVLEMSPSEYNRLMVKDSEGRKLTDTDKANSDYYVEKFKNGERVDIPYIYYDKNGNIDGQEGRHRAYAAEKAGIEKIPVVIRYEKGHYPFVLVSDRFNNVTESFVKRADTNPNAGKIEELNGKIQTNRSLISTNKAQQLEYIDDIKRYTKNLMERAQAANKGSNAKLDIDSYLNIQVTNGLKDALASKNMVGKIQKVLNKAVENANPWVDPETIIRRRAESAAVAYRKKVIEELKAEQKAKEGAKGVNMDKVNAMADKVMDRISRKIRGERESEVTFLDEDGMPKTEILTNYDQPNVIRYKLDGKEYRMVLEGKGAEELVSEFYAPEYVAPKTTAGHILRGVNNVARAIGQGKRYLTTAADFARALPNLMRDWSRGIVTTGGQILLSPDKYFEELIAVNGYTGEQAKLIRDGLMLARQSLKDETLTASLEMPRKNREREMIRALVEPDGNGFVRFVYDLKHFRVGRILSTAQDTVETFTRMRAMDTAYYKSLSDSQSRGLSVDESIKIATEDAYFAGREATVNFFRRGELVSKVAQYVPYLTQRFATIESFKNTYINDPIGMTRALKTTVSAYTTLIALALSNEESRGKYFLLSEYDRSNNIIIPIDNGAIMTIPLDETISAFLTPYRRMVESLNGLDPESFYLCFAEGLGALSPLDLSGFSEGDGFNVARGFEKIGAQVIPTWAMPFVEVATGRDWYYGSGISVDADYIGMTTGNWTPNPGELTTKGKNSQTLKEISNATGFPQWMLQEFLSEYGGNIGQYVLNMVDKVGGATEEAQGGKEWIDSVFKPFTGGDSNQARNDFYTLVNNLKEDKKKLQNEIKTLTNKINSSGGNEKANLIKERQEKIRNYGLHVSDAISSYLSAYEITGGLSKKLANQAVFLYKIYDEDSNRDLYVTDTTGDYFTDKAAAWNNKQMTALAAESGLDLYVNSPVNDFYDTYAEQAFKNTSYGDSYNYIAEIETILNNNNLNRSNMFKGYDKMTSAQKKQWKADWNTQVVKALAPYVQEVGVDNLMNDTKVADYLGSNVNGIIFVNDPWHVKDYLKKIFGGK